MRMERKLKRAGLTLVVFTIAVSCVYFYKTDKTLVPAIKKRNKIGSYKSGRHEFPIGYTPSTLKIIFNAKKPQKEDDYTKEKSSITLPENYFGPARNASNDKENEPVFLLEYDKIFQDNTSSLIRAHYSETHNATANPLPSDVYDDATPVSETTSPHDTSTNGTQVTPNSDGDEMTHEMGHNASATSRTTSPDATQASSTSGVPGRTTPYADEATVPSSEVACDTPGDAQVDVGKEEFVRRARVVRDACRQFKVRQNATAAGLIGNMLKVFNNPEVYVEYVSSENFRLARSASTMTCLINKVASTSVAVALLQADGRQLPEWNEMLSPHNAAAVLKPKTQLEFQFARRHFFKFLLVRHPFERLLSAYRDKVERADHWSLKELRQHIFDSLGEMRQKTLKKTPSTAINDTGGTSERPGGPDQQDPIPTFADFLEYILTTNLSDGGFDSHWAPYWRTCSPCSMNYDAIAKLETAELDLKLVWQRMGLQWTTGLPQYNRSGTGGPLSQSGTEVDQYYSALHPTLIARVYRRFALDFHLFQYDIMDVFRRGGHCQTNDCQEMNSYL
ncbi:LOW QUALITY PROTEIN: uncharacterized protein [Panulirus ornatus]|uniref:LOW QUALITY PROTEIN: uncharacterized protein n=1 Tax=Panulirus ornatus TaxID=150431 RepID=UPI003A8BCC0D